MNDDEVYAKAEQVADRQRFHAQDVADLLLESDVGEVLESLNRLVEAGRLRRFTVSAEWSESDGDEFEGFAFPD